MKNRRFYELKQEIEALNLHLAEVEGTLRAIRQGEIDALVISGDQGLQVFALRSAEQPYRILVEEMNQGAAMLSSDGIILYANRRLAEILDLPSNEIISAYFQLFVSPKDRATWRMLVHLGQSNGRSDGELTVRTPAGRAVPLFLALNKLPPEAGADLGLLVTDLTERKRAEEELRRRNRELALLNRIIAAATETRDDIALLNLACRELGHTFHLPHVAALFFNQNKTEVTVVAEYCQPDRPTALHLTLPVLDPPVWKQFLTGRTPVVSADAATDPRFAPYADWLQRFRIAALVLHPLLAEDEVRGILALVDDHPHPFSESELQLAWHVTEQVNNVLTRLQITRDRQQLEEQFLQSQKMEAIGRLAGGVAHDFNNLLTVINGHAEWALEALPPHHALCADLEAIRQAGDRAAALTRQLLALSRKQVLQPELLDLNLVVSELKNLLTRLIGENIDLHVHLSPELKPVRADRSQLEQVIINLVVNARDAMPHGGALMLETASAILDESFARRHVDIKAGPYVLLAVSDTGVGMDRETMSHIFEPFFTTKETGKGTGLGLSTVHGIIKQSGGYIQVYSEPGHGTTFKIYLPCAAKTAGVAAAQLPSRPETLTGVETVLIVEDDPAVRQLMRRILSGNGYTILSARTGHQAQKIFSDSVELLLTDVVLPDLSGRQLAETLRQQSPRLKVLYTSGYTNNVIAHHGLQEAGFTFLQKPFSPTALLQKVREVLDAR